MSVDVTAMAKKIQLRTWCSCEKEYPFEVDPDEKITDVKFTCENCGEIKYSFGEQIKNIKCPNCNSENKLRIPSGYQISDIHHADDKYRNKIIHIGHDEIEYYCKKCNEPFHILFLEGNVVPEKHWLELLLEVPGKAVKKRHIMGLVSVPGFRYFLAILTAIIIGFLVGSLWFLLFYSLTGNEVMIRKDFNLTFGALNAFAISISYIILKEVRKISGKLERNVSKKNRLILYKPFLDSLYSWKIYIIFLSFHYIFSIGIRVMTDPDYFIDDYKINIPAFLPSNIFLTALFQIFVMYGVFLFSLSYLVVGRFFELKEKISKLSSISMIIVFFLAVRSAQWVGSFWFLSSEGERATFSPGYAYLWCIAVPIISVLVPFSIYNYLIYRVASTPKDKELNEIKSKSRDIIEDIEGGLQKVKQKGLESSQILTNTTKTHIQSLYLSMLFSREEEVKKSRVWGVDMKKLSQVGFSLFVALSPWLLKML